MPNTSIKTVSYTIFNTGANNVIVDGQTISPNRSFTVTHGAANADLDVKTVDGMSSSVRVLATGTAIDTDGKDYAFTAKEATATFTSTSVVADLYTGVVDSYNTDKKELVFVGKDAVKYAGETGKTYEYKGIGNTPIATAENFIDELKKGKTTVTREVKGNTVTFYIIEQTAGTAPEDTTSEKAALKTAVDSADAAIKAAVVGDAPGNYSQAAVDTYKAAVATAKTVLNDVNSTDAQLKAAKATLDTATKAFNDAVVKENPVAVAKAELKTAVDAAKVKADAAKVGTAVGEYTQAAVDTYKAAIDAATAVWNKADATVEQVNAAKTTLATATTAFENAANKEEVGQKFEITNADITGLDILVGLGAGTFEVEGTVAKEDLGKVSKVKLTFEGGLNNPENPGVDISSTTLDVDVDAAGKFSISELVGTGTYKTVKASYTVDGTAKETAAKKITKNGK
ncbi:FIVAR domain-containing protein [Sporosarcina ureae]|uniref:Uncharacterized protein n=1 Tax=Sporosarcina ureae TaxID=1571 RepID=A0ABN4YS74_SPOUR|nr:FIVAR domain-containing protein [Sporosarcina ureae]ARF14894.1 hypothetical protein SporoS204_12465 [Sporosarcina ureae]